MRKTPEVIADAAAAAAVVLLLAVLAGRVLLLSGAMPAPHAQALLAPRGRADGEPARLVLVVDRDAVGESNHTVERIRTAYPGRRLEVHPVSWGAPDGGRSREASVAALVRMYGYSELPILLTLTQEGQVVRVQPFAEPE